MDVRVEQVPAVEDLAAPTLTELAAGHQLPIIDGEVDVLEADHGWSVLVVRREEPADSPWQIGQEVEVYAVRYDEDSGAYPIQDLRTRAIIAA